MNFVTTATGSVATGPGPVEIVKVKLTSVGGVPAFGAADTTKVMRVTEQRRAEATD